MKSKFVCFKLSKTIIILFLIILLEIGFILFQVKELREGKSLEQIKEDMNQINEEKRVENKIENMNIIMPKEEENIVQNETIQKVEKKNMKLCQAV